MSANPSFGWLLLPRGAEELASIVACGDYRADTEAGFGRAQPSSPEIRQFRGSSASWQGAASC